MTTETTTTTTTTTTTIELVVEKKNRRFGKGVVIALSRKIYKLNSMCYRVESETQEGKFYTVICKNGDGPSSCNCPDYDHHKEDNKEWMCKHKWAIMKAIEANVVIDATERKVKLEYERDQYDF